MMKRSQEPPSTAIAHLCIKYIRHILDLSSMALDYKNPNDWGRSPLTDSALRKQQFKAENPEEWAAMIEADIEALSTPIFESEDYQSQQSGLMLWFGQLPMDKKAVAIGLSLTVGIGSAAMAWQGTSSDRIYFCIKTPLKTLTCSDLNGRPFRMTPFYWSQWKSDGMPRQIVRNPAMGVNGLVKATNPYKPFWGAIR